jgi:glycine/D-amino acid oxidase-like deaminating enzyme
VADRRARVVVADLAWSSSLALVPKVPLPLLKLAKALARLKPLPRDQNALLELLRSTRDFLSAVLPSLPVDSWPLPRH